MANRFLLLLVAVLAVFGSLINVASAARSLTADNANQQGGSGRKTVGKKRADKDTHRIGPVAWTLKRRWKSVVARQCERTESKQKKPHCGVGKCQNDNVSLDSRWIAYEYSSPRGQSGLGT